MKAGSGCHERLGEVYSVFVETKDLQGFLKAPGKMGSEGASGAKKPGRVKSKSERMGERNAGALMKVEGRRRGLC